MKVLISKLDQGFDDGVNDYFFKAGVEVAALDKIADHLLVGYPNMYKLVKNPTIEVPEESVEVPEGLEEPKKVRKAIGRYVLGFGGVCGALYAILRLFDYL